MKVLDPQAALLTTPEVHQFLSSNPPRPKQQKIGTYKPVDLNNYNVVRDDFQHYVTTTVPYISAISNPEAFIQSIVPKLRRLGLTKTEALMLINLGVGTQRSGSQQLNSGAAAPSVNGDGMAHDEDMAEEEPEQDDRQLLSLVIEELDERFPGDEGSAKIDNILQVMKDSYNTARTINGVAHPSNGTSKT
ncbi:hypothetical protein LTR84_001094 [Exophiala bonariae]|uniref:DNA-directed RNA polymerase III subunit RPC9 n=1 Tax=Exophiala bonariae TaxID=1690606 RepID=A0AAV9NSF2_9EURO|nr:hypothetical protein LTR84_001094 [Exophiala bonariae]